MCRNLKLLRRPEGSPTQDELRAASLQFVRKITGYRQPSSVNQEIFDRAIDQIVGVSERLLDQLQVREVSTT